MTPTNSEEQVRADLEAMGLRERLSEEDFALSVRDEVRARDRSLGSTALVSVAPLARAMTTSLKPQTVEVPPRLYRCEACEDGGYVLTATKQLDATHFVRAQPIPCPRCVPLTDRARAAGIEEMFAEARLETLVVRPGNKAAVEFARNWDGQSSVLITSRTRADGESTDEADSAWGTGKTHIACAMLIGQIAKARPARFLYAKHFLSGIQSLFGAAPGSVEAYIAAVSNTPLLLLDDLGAERPTDWAREQMRTLIDDRYRRKLVTLVTSNYGTLDKIADVFGGAVADRLRDYTHVKVGGRSMRGTAR